MSIFVMPEKDDSTRHRFVDEFNLGCPPIAVQQGAGSLRMAVRLRNDASLHIGYVADDLSVAAFNRVSLVRDV